MVDEAVDDSEIVALEDADVLNVRERVEDAEEENDKVAVELIDVETEDVAVELGVVSLQSPKTPYRWSRTAELRLPTTSHPASDTR